MVPPGSLDLKLNAHPAAMRAASASISSHSPDRRTLELPGFIGPVRWSMIKSAFPLGNGLRLAVKRAGCELMDMSPASNQATDAIVLNV